jgi:hypothetical protein
LSAAARIAEDEMPGLAPGIFISGVSLGEHSGLELRLVKETGTIPAYRETPSGRT